MVLVSIETDKGRVENTFNLAFFLFISSLQWSSLSLLQLKLDYHELNFRFQAVQRGPSSEGPRSRPQPRPQVQEAQRQRERQKEEKEREEEEKGQEEETRRVSLLRRG